MNIKEEIYNNPYRVLGVYVDSSAAEESSNLAKIAAFSKVGRQADFSTPHDSMLQPIARTAESANEAQQSLSLPRERLHHALLWYARSDEQWANLLNSAVDSLLAGSIVDALRFYETLIYTDEYRTAFCQAATHGLSTGDVDQLANIVAHILQLTSTTERNHATTIIKNLNGYQSKILIAYYYNRDHIEGAIKQLSDVICTPFNIDAIVEKWSIVVDELDNIIALFGATDNKTLVATTFAFDTLYDKCAQLLKCCHNWYANIVIRNKNFDGGTKLVSTRSRAALAKAQSFADKVDDFLAEYEQYLPDNDYIEKSLAKSKNNYIRARKMMLDFTSNKVKHYYRDNWPTLLINSAIIFAGIYIASLLIFT